MNLKTGPDLKLVKLSLDENVVLLPLELVHGGVLLSNARVRGTIDALAVEEPLALGEVITLGCNVLDEFFLGSMIGHRPFLADASCPASAPNASKPVRVSISILDL